MSSSKSPTNFVVNLTLPPYYDENGNKVGQHYPIFTAYDVESCNQQLAVPVPSSSSHKCHFRHVRYLLKCLLVLVFFIALNIVIIKIIAPIEFHKFMSQLQTTESSPTNKIFIQQPRKYQSQESTNTRKTELEDVFIGVKTTAKYHNTRVQLLLQTWAAYAKQQTYFFTDKADSQLETETGRGHLINTKCPVGHTRRSLCCKMAVEFDTFLASNKRWFCHVDDDTYLNIPRLMQLLRSYSHEEAHYLGKPSLDHPLEILDRFNHEKVAFWFATGGAGMCISRPMALKLAPLAQGGKLMSQCENIRLPDDVTLGYLIESVLGEHLTVVSEFHSHLEGLYSFTERQLPNMISFSYSQWESDKNVLDVPGFSKQVDPTRLKSAHCLLYPYVNECKSMNRLRR